MTVPLWVLALGGVVSLVTGLLGGGGIASIIVARINSKSAAQIALPDQLLKALQYSAEENERDRQRLDHIEGFLVIYGDHIDLLEDHIWKGKPPPPPERPVYRPMGRSDTP